MPANGLGPLIFDKLPTYAVQTNRERREKN
jgi:hypothetical protein